MVLLRDTRRFELTVEPLYNVWVATLRGFTPGSLLPTTYLLRHCTTRAEAILALQRRWHVLFPEEEVLVWQEPTAFTTTQAPHRPRPSEGRPT
ncbi:MAG: hypothetical protein FJZ47_03370 [Candidatus Tectomicrobia bacterium]|uniref:Uncharacterized protein n=1 Tax=Tectimicrobiota bacterium TaxID=2528274 RepID=A0A937VZ73_UNCTE|nr:hypothetical protein [Candidatus Tectomicrobia bacterium]